MKRLVGPVVVCLLLLAGCASPDSTPTSSPATPTTDDHPTTTPPTSTPSPTLGPGDPPFKYAPRAFALTNCTHHATVFLWPSDLAPGDTPEGWEPSLTVQSTFRMDFFQCQRFAWGRFERPVNITVESHNKRVMPDACNVGQGYVPFIMERMWIDDAEIVQYLNGTYLIPARYASISTTPPSTGSVREETWTITPPGATASTMTFRGQGGADMTTPGGIRYVWSTAFLMGFLDLGQTAHYHFPEGVEDVGHLEPPMLHAETGLKEWVGSGAWETNMEGDGEIFLWRDNLCEMPA